MISIKSVEKIISDDLFFGRKFSKFKKISMVFWLTQRIKWFQNSFIEQSLQIVNILNVDKYFCAIQFTFQSTQKLSINIDYD